MSNKQIKFRQADNVHIIFGLDNGDHMNNVSISSAQIFPHIIIGPLIDRMRCVKSFYEIIVEDHPDIQKISREYFSVMSQTGDEIRFATKYTDFKKHFKIVYAHELNELSTPLTDDDLIEDLDFMKREIVTCQINMNILKQKGDMDKFSFYENLINNQQHIMFQVHTAEQYAEYLDKIAKLLDNNADDVINKEKQIMNDVMNLSKEVW
jgi:hypothetical protein